MYKTIVLACATAITVLAATPAALVRPAPPAVGVECDSTGPDVIVGRITGPANYSSNGGIEAFAFGTTSCNIGDEKLDWFDNTPQHPVISQNLYVIRPDGRFDQIGQAWLKHGFFALQGNACGCGCNPDPQGDQLGVGCSDPYSAGLNGTQNGMGPKFEVNASTGEFPWPPTDFFDTGNSIYKRLQVDIDDLDPGLDGGGVYIVECQYVAADDAAAGNDNNNASWREVTISGNGNAWSADLTGDTREKRTAVQAWRSFVPGVEVQNVNIDDDGRFKVAWHATPTGGGAWDYQVAVENLNSDRSARSVTIPLPAGTTVFAADFNDVDYHSGEPYDGTDWAVTVGSSSIEWSTESFSSNPNANALRWATTYTFRFTADAPPGAVNEMEIRLFKPGSPNSVTVPLFPPACTGDLTGDDAVNVADLLLVLESWGGPGGDADGDGLTNVSDLLVVLGSFGPCP